MRVAGSTRCYLDPREEGSLSRMARDRRRPSPRAEDGELSDAGSPEEASAKRFELEPSRVSRSGMWGFSYPRNYAPELYNLAWARAVQNKPLELDFVGPPAVGEEEEEEEELGGDEVGPGESGGGDGEGEEGELEEGEIEFGSEAVAVASEPSLNEHEKELEEEKGVEDEEGGEEMEDFDRQVSLILEELEAVTEEEVEKSFEQVCTRLRKSFESLKPMVSETHVPPVINALVQQAFMGIQTIHSAISLGGLKKMEQNKDLFLRLLIHLKNQYHILLTPEQLQEIDTMVKSLVFENDGKEKDINAGSGCDTNNSAKIDEKPDIPSHGMVSLEKPYVDQRAFNTGLSKLELSIMIPRIKTEFSPLLDLHADYDESSLPSPTRENPPPLPVQRPIEVGMGDVISTQPITTVNTEAEDATLHPYVTDPFKAVSTYQQKYGRSSLFSTNQLPSPTPSEESNDGNDGDRHGEVSSSLAASNAGASNPLPSSLLVVSSSSDAAYNSSGHQQLPVKTFGPSSSLPNPVTKAPAKSRDPRLRFINSENGGPNSNRHPMSIDSNAPKNGSLGEIVNSRKHKDFDESVLDDRNLKRQRNSNASSAGMQAASGNGGWLEDSIHQPSDKNHVNENVPLDMKKLGDTETGSISSERRPDKNTKFASNGGVGQKPSSAAASVCSPSLLKDFKDISAVNPTMLIQLLQQRLAPETQQKTADPVQLPSTNGLLGTVPALNIAPIKSTETDQNQAGRPQMPAQSASMNARNDIGRIRMKPRDPRRILHSNIIQKNENLGSELSRTNGHLSLDDLNNKDNIKIREPGEQTQTAGLPSQLTPLPDVAWQLTKNVNNLADIVPSSQSTSNSLALPQNNSQPIAGKNSKADIMPATTETSIQKPAFSSSCEAGISSASHLPNLWGNVDHLLDGYDDQQKAAIQRERARRIEEQNKMFASRKLCLVLDLDHTLLNSAKFAEVDPVHDEILRKKEELDREKPQRHLFRFLHMGMWTKLRPGIWNFLEKASKLYELHLYTMGNKLYATEMAKVLDPTGVLFAGRVISRGDDGDPFDGDDRVPKSKDLDGVLGMESAVVIIDDSVRVWPHNKLNLIVVERYTYFPCSRRQFGLFGPSLLEIDHDERPEDGTLASSLAVIERIHQNFFSHRSLNEVDVRNILAAEQHKILAGCKIVFSRIFPVGEANPHFHPLWQTAEQFGAVCTNQIDEQVTHVVANSLGTDKVNWALSTGRFVVHPGWVEASALLYRRANELDFLVKQ